jgi:hypothetical protein
LTIKLDGIAQGKLHKILLLDLYNMASLDRLLNHQLNFGKLEGFSTGKDFHEVVEKVLDDLNRDGRIGAFIRAAMVDRPNSDELKEFCIEYQIDLAAHHSAAIRKRTPKEYDLDLNPQISKSFDSITKEMRLIGIGIPCIYPNTLRFFCERFTQLWGATKIGYSHFDTIKPPVLDIDRVIEYLDNYKAILEVRDMLVGIQISQAKHLKQVWQCFKDKYNDGYWRDLPQNNSQANSAKPTRLIVVTVLESKNKIPRDIDIVKLDQIKLNRSDIVNMIDNVLSAMSFSDTYKDCLRRDWEDKVVVTCSRKGNLDVHYTFSYFEKALKYLEDRRSINFTELKQAIEKGFI